MSVSLPAGVSVFDADGALSREYLRHRGYCCENGCRNCPYEFRQRQARAAQPSASAYVPASGVPQRIVSLCPSNTELLHALGLGAKLVGIDDWSDWPASVTHLPRVGPDLNVDLDRVEALRPDLILASLSVPGMERNVTRLQERGLPHLVLDPHGIEDLWDNLRAVGRVCDAERTAERVVAELKARVHRVRETTLRAACQPRVYWEWWPKPLFAPGRRNWLTPLSELAGCRSVTAHVDADTARPSADEIRDADPDWIFLAWTGVAREKVRPDVLLRRTGWSELAAVREGRVRIMEEGHYCRPSPRLITGLEQLARLVHPQLFATYRSRR